MKNTKLYLGIVLILSFVFITACSDDKDNQDQLPNFELIAHSEILGVYKVKDSQSSTISKGDIWSIKVKSANIGCTKSQPYSYKNNTFVIGDDTYIFERTEDKESFKVSHKDGANTISFTLGKTESKCGDQEEEVEITKTEILGTFKVVDAYTNESGSEPVKSDLLIGKIWNIEDAEVNINCALQSVAYTYEKNTITAEGINYQIEKENSQLIITYLLENSIVTLYLEPTTETCPEDEGPQVGDVELDKMYGFAAMAGTTGGEGATAENIHHFDNGLKFRDWLKAREKAKSKVPAIVWLSGTFTKEQGRGAGSPWFDFKDTENITIYGTNSFRMKNVGFFLSRANNIIIRNVYIEMPKADNGADGISMQKSSKVWVDHCTFESMNSTKDYEDGSCDITHGSTDVTVSWNHFIKTQKTSLVGHSNNENQRPEDSQIRATYHHNFFDQSSSRHPRVRYGTVHVFNNFFNAVTTYGVGSAYSARLLVESNYFDNVHLPTDICTFPAKKSGSSWVSNLQGDEAGFLFEAENHYANQPSNASDPYPFVNVEYKKYGGEKLAAPFTRADFTPSYTYVVDKAETIANIVPSGAGVAKLPNYENAPLDVNNGNMPEPGENPGEGESETDEGVDLGNDWTGLNIGSANGSASVVSDGNGISISGAGKFESGAQSFFYVYREFTGDFVMTARVDAFATTGNSNQAQAGLMLTPDVTKTANDFFHAGGGLGGSKNLDENKVIIPSYYYTHRLENKAASKGSLTAPSATGGDTYIKLERVGDKYIITYSLDGGVIYGKERNGTFVEALPSVVKVGFYISGGNGQSSASFSDIKINGTSIGFVD